DRDVVVAAVRCDAASRGIDEEGVGSSAAVDRNGSRRARERLEVQILDGKGCERRAALLHLAVGRVDIQRGERGKAVAPEQRVGAVAAVDRFGTSPGRGQSV